ncbi:MAG: CHRD domain-containing protein, partial [Nitrososphaeraceae archaeon]
GNFSENGDVITTLFTSKNPNDTINGTLVEGKIVSTDLQGPLEEKTIADLVNLINTTQTYVNIHSIEYPNGEIRGQITTVNATNWWD